MSGTMTNGRMTGKPYKTGVLTNTTPVVVTMEDAPLPCNVWTLPATDTVNVSYSFDAGVSYVAWTPGAVTAFAKEILYAGVTHVKFTATAGGTSTYGIL